jgi:hypothetical protein
VSPFNLKTNPGLIAALRDPFAGLHGLFNDSLPDGWGNALDRILNDRTPAQALRRHDDQDSVVCSTPHVHEKQKRGDDDDGHNPGGGSFGPRR